MMKTLATFILIIGFVATASAQFKPGDSTLIALEWNYLNYADPSGFSPELAEIDCNCAYKFDDKGLLVVPKMNSSFTITYQEEKRTVLVKESPHYKPSWEKFSFDEEPPALTKDESWAWGNFWALKLLNKPAPGFNIQDTNGVAYSEKNLNGKITILNFWFYKCMPCRAEIPALNQVNEHFENNSEVQFWAFSADSTVNTSISYSFHHFPDSKKLEGDFYIHAYPKTFVIDQKGIVRNIFVGASMGDNSILKKNLLLNIENLLR